MFYVLVGNFDRDWVLRLCFSYVISDVRYEWINLHDILAELCDLNVCVFLYIDFDYDPAICSIDVLRHYSLWIFIKFNLLWVLRKLHFYSSIIHAA